MKSTALARNTRLFFFVFSGWLCVGCQSVPTSTRTLHATGESPHFDVADAPKLVSIQFLNGRAQAFIPRTEFFAKQEYPWGTYFLLGLDEKTGIECFVYSEITVLGALVRHHLLETISGVVSANEGKSYRILSGETEFSHVNGRPKVEFVTTISISHPNDTLVNDIMVYAILVDETPMVCVSTFRQLNNILKDTADTLAATARVTNQNGDTAQLSELRFIEVGGRTVGFSRSSYTVGSGGKTKLETIEASIQPQVGASPIVTDALYEELTTADNALVHSSVKVLENGILNRDLRLGFADEPWTVSGTIQNKRIDEPISTKDRMTSTLEQTAVIKQSIQGELPTTLEFSTWIPTLRATQATTIVYEVEKAESGVITGSARIGPLLIDTEFDHDGGIVSSSFVTSGVQTEINRVWTSRETSHEVW